MLSFGATNYIRDWLGTNDVVNKCSWTYTAGMVAGFANTVALGWAGGTKAVAKAASGNNWANFSHSLFPKKFLKGFDTRFTRWLNKTGNRLNGDYVSPELHTRIDVAAQFGLDKAWLAANPLFSPFRLWINRLPYFPGSLLFGAGSASMNSGSGDCGCN